jgi:hypothetical protein
MPRMKGARTQRPTHASRQSHDSTCREREIYFGGELPIAPRTVSYRQKSRVCVRVNVRACERASMWVRGWRDHGEAAHEVDAGDEEVHEGLGQQLLHLVRLPSTPTGS